MSGACSSTVAAWSSRTAPRSARNLGHGSRDGPARRAEPTRWSVSSCHLLERSDCEPLLVGGPARRRCRTTSPQLPDLHAPPDFSHPRVYSSSHRGRRLERPARRSVLRQVLPNNAPERRPSMLALRARSILLWVVKDRFWRRGGQSSDGPLELKAGSYQATRCRAGCERRAGKSIAGQSTGSTCRAARTGR